MNFQTDFQKKEMKPMDAFDKAFQKCNKQEQKAILSMTAEQFAKDLCESFNIPQNKNNKQG